MTDARATQVSIEEFTSTNPPVQVTQVTIEQWVPTATISGQVLVTQAALEQWIPVTPVELAGNLVLSASFSANLTALRGLSGNLAPSVVFSATGLSGVIDLAGNLAPQVTFNGQLSLLAGIADFVGHLTSSVVFAASVASRPLWEPIVCPPSMWTPIGPCDAVEWGEEACPLSTWAPSSSCSPVNWQTKVN